MHAPGRAGLGVRDGLHEPLLDQLALVPDLADALAEGAQRVGGHQGVATCYRPPSRIFAFIARRGATNAITEHWKSFEEKRMTLGGELGVKNYFDRRLRKIDPSLHHLR